MKEAANCGGLKCPQGVISGGLALGRKLPVCPYEPTCSCIASTEAMGHERSSRATIE